MTVDLAIFTTFLVPRTLSPARRPKESEEGGGESRPVSSFFDRAAVVVLGDPGAGKTETFKQAAREEAGVYLSVRKFVRLSPEPYRGQVLYLDGLDEVRAHSADGNTAIDDVIRRLDQIGRPRFRLSCRAADWFGGLDRGALQEVSPDGELTVLRLDPLTEEDITAIVAQQVSDPEDFVSQARARGVYGLLENPHTLGLILKVVVGRGDWPATKRDLYEEACRSLAQERNEEHARGPRGRIAEEAVLDAAGQLCAVHLCAGTAGFAVERPAEDQDFPYIGVLGEDRLSAASIAGRLNLFRSEDPETIVPLHRSRRPGPWNGHAAAQRTAPGDRARPGTPFVPAERRSGCIPPCLFG